MKHMFCKAICLILAVCVFTGISLSALAESAELKTTQQFIDYLEKKDIKYTLIGLSDGSEQITVSFNLEYLNSAKCNLFFDEDLDSVSLRLWNLVTVSAGKNYILSTVNSLNKSYKYAKFVYDDSDSSIQIEADMYIDEDHGARSVFDMMMILFSIADNEDIAKTLLSLE